jgi:hypothetical protein
MKKLILILILISFGVHSGSYQVVPKDLSKWEKGIIPFIFDKSIDEVSQKKITNFLLDFQKQTGIAFVPVDHKEILRDLGIDRTMPMLIQAKGNACYFTQIGYSSVKNTMNLGPNCRKKRTVFHEIGHAVGMAHEHLHPERDEYLRIEIPDKYKNNISFISNVSMGYYEDYVHQFPFDPSSIMLYASAAYKLGKDGTTLLIDKDKTVAPVVSAREDYQHMFEISKRTMHRGEMFYWIKQAQTLSTDDITKIRAIYNYELSRRSTSDKLLLSKSRMMIQD